MVEPLDFEEQKNGSAELLVENGAANGVGSDGDDNEGDDQAQLPSSFYSQVPFQSQVMLNGGNLGDDEEDQRLELFQMSTLLHNEKMAPELLPFQFSLVEKILRMIS